VVDVKDNQDCRDDVADLPWAEADVAQRSERGLEQAVAAFTDRAEPVVGVVELLWNTAASLVPGFLEGDDDGVGFVFVAEVGQDPQGGSDSGEGVEQAGVCPQAGGVVFPAGPHRRGPQRPAVRSGQDLDVAAVVGVFLRPL
jgi:hypothetical protein